jgi:hypothetical protein
MKQLFLFLTLLGAGFAADAANDVILSQRKADNSGSIQRNVAPVASGFLTFDASKVPTSPAGLTWVTPTLSVPDAFNILSAGSIDLTAGGTNENITLTPSGTGSLLSRGNFEVTGTAVNRQIQVDTTTSGTIHRSGNQRDDWRSWFWRWR